MLSSYVAAAPFASGVFLALLSPRVTTLVCRQVSQYLEQADRRSGARAAPPHRSTRFIGDYLHYATDVSQVFACGILVVVGTVAIVAVGVSAATIVLIVAVAIPLVFYALLRLITMDPSVYAGSSWHGYSPFAILSGLANLAAFVVVFAAVR